MPLCYYEASFNVLDHSELRTLVSEIADKILACPSRADEGGYPCGWECSGCRQQDGGSAGRSASGVAGIIDHTLLKPDATREDIVRVCREARQCGFASVCVNPYWVPVAASELSGSGVKVCTVVGFPLGASSAASKRAETEEALSQGAHEIDMVINVGALRSGETAAELAA